MEYIVKTISPSLKGRETILYSGNDRWMSREVFLANSNILATQGKANGFLLKYEVTSDFKQSKVIEKNNGPVKLNYSSFFCDKDNKCLKQCCKEF